MNGSNHSPALWALLLSIALSACNGSAPVLRGSQTAASPATADSGDSTASECAQLRTEIRTSREAQREAPTTSTSPQIVDAAEGKADKRIDELQQQLDGLDCPSETATDKKVPPLAPLPPAPGGANHP